MRKRKLEILEAVPEIAMGLHQAGLMDVINVRFG